MGGSDKAVRYRLNFRGADCLGNVSMLLSRMKERTPAELGYRMPAEWERHEATWLSWPRREGISFPDRSIGCCRRCARWSQR